MKQIRHAEFGMRNDREKFQTLNVPQRVHVELDNGRPAKLLKAQATRSIESILECWRIDDEWWRQPISRTYYEVVLETGGRVVVFQDLNTSEWWMQT